MKFLVELWRYWFKSCLDCGVKLGPQYNRGDVCEECFKNWNGLTIEQLME